MLFLSQPTTMAVISPKSLFSTSNSCFNPGSNSSSSPTWYRLNSSEASSPAFRIMYTSASVPMSSSCPVSIVTRYLDNGKCYFRYPACTRIQLWRMYDNWRNETRRSKYLSLLPALNSTYKVPSLG